MDDYLAVAISLAGGIAVYELYVWLPRMSQTIKQWAVRLLPSAMRDAYSAEWEAHLSEMPNSLVALIESLGLVFAALRFRLPSIEHSTAKWIAVNFFLPQFRRFHHDAIKLTLECEANLQLFLKDADELGQSGNEAFRRRFAAIGDQLRTNLEKAGVLREEVEAQVRIAEGDVHWRIGPLVTLELAMLQHVVNKIRRRARKALKRD